MWNNNNWTIWIKAFGRFSSDNTNKISIINFGQTDEHTSHIVAHTHWCSHTRGHVVAFRCINLCRKMLPSNAISVYTGRPQPDRFNALKSKHVWFYHILATTVTYYGAQPLNLAFHCFSITIPIIKYSVKFNQIWWSNFHLSRYTSYTLLFKALILMCSYRVLTHRNTQNEMEKIQRKWKKIRWGERAGVKGESCH